MDRAKRLDLRKALIFSFVFFVLPTPTVLRALGLWHHNDILWRLVAMLAFDGLLFLVLRSFWRQLPEAGPPAPEFGPSAARQTISE